MALDGIELNSGSGGQTLATDTVSGLDFQIVKIGVGVDDATPTSVSDSNPMPVDDAGGSLTVDNAGTFAVQVDGAALTALQLIDNIVSVEDAVHGSGDSGVMALAVRNDTLAALGSSDGDYAPLQVNASGALFIQEGTAMDVSGATVTVTDDGSFTLAANSGVDIGDVDVTSIVPGTAAGSLGKAEDAAHSSGDTGVMMLAVRNDTLAALAGTDGDYAPFQVNASGALFVQEGAAMDVSAATVTVTDDGSFNLAANDGVDIGDVDVTSILPGTGATNLGKVEDAAHSSGDVGVMALVVRNDTLAALAGADGDYAPLQVNASGALFIQEGAAMDVSAATVTVDNGGTFAVQVDGDALTALQLIDNIVSVEDEAHGSGDSGVMALAVRNDTLAALAGTDGDYAPLQVNASGALFVQEGAALDVSGATVTVDNGGTFAVQVDGDALTALQTIDDIVHSEDLAHNEGDAGVMALAVRNDTLATLAGTDGDYAPVQVNASGALYVQEGAAMDVSAATVTVTDDGSFTLAANAGTQVGDVKAILSTDAVLDGTTSETPSFAAFDVNSSGDNEIVAGVASNKIRVLSLAMNAFGDVEAEFQSGSTTTNISGTFDLGTSTGKAKGLVLPFSPLGHFESASGTALDLNLSDGVQVSGVLTYIVVAA